MVEVLGYNFREKGLFNSEANILKVVKEVGLKFAFGLHMQQICEYYTQDNKEVVKVLSEKCSLSLLGATYNKLCPYSSPWNLL